MFFFFFFLALRLQWIVLWRTTWSQKSISMEEELESVGGPGRVGVDQCFSTAGNKQQMEEPVVGVTSSCNCCTTPPPATSLKAFC